MRGILRRQWPLMVLAAALAATAGVTYVRQRPYLQDTATMQALRASSTQIAAAGTANQTAPNGAALPVLPAAPALLHAANVHRPDLPTFPAAMGAPGAAVQPGIVYLSPDSTPHQFVIALRSPSGRVFTFTYAMNQYGAPLSRWGIRLVAP